MPKVSSLVIAIALLVAGAWLAAIVMVASSLGGDAEVRRERALQAFPEELWSIEAVPAPAGWRPATVCADARMRSGFTRPAAAVGAAPCFALEAPVESPGRTALRCRVNGQVLGQSASYAGDLRQDFTTTFTYVNFDRRLAGTEPSVYEQVLRFRRLGPCPAGWTVGEHTDRYGRRHADARLLRQASADVR